MPRFEPTHMERINTDSVESLSQGLSIAWLELADALNRAAPHWNERRLESEDPNADAWSPRLAAWHAISGERVRVSYLRHLLATRPTSPPEMMQFARSNPIAEPTLAGLQREFRDVQTPEAMMQILETARTASKSLLAELGEADLEAPAPISGFMLKYLREREQSPASNIRGVLLHGIVHLLDHARQIAD